MLFTIHHSAPVAVLIYLCRKAAGKSGQPAYGSGSSSSGKAQEASAGRKGAK
jgi:hypothetical protein